MTKLFKSMMVTSGALALAASLAAAPAHAGVAASDVLNVFDGSGALVSQTVALEDGSEDPGFIYVNPTLIDPNQFGNATVLRESDGSDSDIFGICTCGPNGDLAFGFASDSETLGVNFGTFPRTFFEGVGGPFDATLYLDQGLQAAGWTATFTSDGVPEPATWAIMLIGFGGIGALLRRRKIGPALV